MCHHVLTLGHDIYSCRNLAIPAMTSHRVSLWWCRLQSARVAGRARHTMECVDVCTCTCTHPAHALSRGASSVRQMKLRSCGVGDPSIHLCRAGCVLEGAHLTDLARTHLGRFHRRSVAFSAGQWSRPSRPPRGGGPRDSEDGRPA